MAAELFSESTITQIRPVLEQVFRDCKKYTYKNNSDRRND